MPRKPATSPSESLAKYVPGAIVPDALYRADEVAARLGWSEHDLRDARRRGLKIHRSGRRNFVLGRDVITAITKGKP